MPHPPEGPRRSEDELLEAYLDGELDVTAAASLERRLTASAELRRELERAREIRATLRSFPEFDASPVTLARVRRLAVAAKPWRRRLRRGVAVAATLAVAVFGASIWRTLDRPAEPDPAEVARAAAEARWVLARVDRLTRKAGATVRRDVLERYLVTTTRRGVAASLLSGVETPVPEAAAGGKEEDDEV